MKKNAIIKSIVVFAIFVIGLTVFDYTNVPTRLGFEMSNINWNFCMGLLNIMIVISLYVITFKTLDEKTLEKDKNKNGISLLLLKSCYQTCMRYIDLLNQETVEKYIVPKTNFDSTKHNGTICDNIQKSPFENESIIMDLVKDGQMTKSQIDGYFKVKEKYMEYINMRIICFDGPHIYEPLKTDLYNSIEKELNQLKI